MKEADRNDNASWRAAIATLSKTTFIVLPYLKQRRDCQINGYSPLAKI